MKQIKLPGTDVSCSRFIFGTASLFNAGAKDTRYRLLKSAVEQGFSHFDTAPYYGFGLAETEMASVLREHPNVTITTKVGIYSPGGEQQSSAAVFARKALGRVVKAVSRPTISFDLERAKQALEGSLRRTGRDIIDIYTLHEPELPLVDTDRWLRWLEDCVRNGKVQTFGLALTADRLEPFLQQAPELCRFVQVMDTHEAQEADVLGRFGKPMQVTYGYVTAARRSGSLMSVAEILTKALKRNSEGAVIVSTTKTERLAQYAQIADRVA